jgi:hypothetical protein
MELREAVMMGQAARRAAFGGEWQDWLARKRLRDAALAVRAEAWAGWDAGGEGWGGADAVTAAAAAAHGRRGHGGARQEMEEGEEGQERGDGGGSDGDGGGYPERLQEQEGEEGGAEGMGRGGGGGGSGGGHAPAGGDRNVAVIDGIVLGWPGAPNQRQRQVLRLQRGAAGLYPEGTAGLLDAHWARQAWWREGELPEGRGSG